MRTPTGLAKPGLPSPAGGEMGALLPSSLTDAELCERAVQAIWKRLDAHDLVDHEVRDQLADLLEPLAAFPLGGRPQRLIQALRMPDPIGASKLYWLTRRLLTLVPELQALEHAGEHPPAGDPSLPH